MVVTLALMVSMVSAKDSVQVFDIQEQAANAALTEHARVTRRMRRTTKPLLSRQVSAGEIAFLKDSAMDVQPIQVAAIDTRLSWRHRELVFTGESLEEVVAEISRYDLRKLIIADDAIRQMQVGGRFQVGDIDNLLDILEHGFGVEINRADDGNVYLAARRPAQE